jgi:tRNA nucleotidyltransferase (CCA-adding enzyme)
LPTISEEQLGAWTQPAFNNEDEKRANTERMIREAIRGHALLRTLPIEVYAKGSYKNNTNVRRDSDVDVAVEYTGITYFEYDSSTNQDEVWKAEGIYPYSGPFRNSLTGETEIKRFKNAVGEALTEAFGSAAVTRHNKVFTVRESQRSLAADVVPCATYRMHWTPTTYSQGIRRTA